MYKQSSPKRPHTLSNIVPLCIWRNHLLLLLMWKHDWSKGLRKLSAAQADHTYPIYPAWTHTRNSELLQIHAGFSGIGASTRFISMRLQDGGDLERGFSSIFSSYFLCLIYTRTASRQRVNFENLQRIIVLTPLDRHYVCTTDSQWGLGLKHGCYQSCAKACFPCQNDPISYVKDGHACPWK